MSAPLTTYKLKHPIRIGLSILMLTGSLSSACLWAQGQVRVVEVHAHRYAFTPAEIVVKKDQAVTLKLISDDVPHSLAVPGLGISQTMTKPHPVEITITPKEPGDFPGKCGRFCGSGHGSMTFIIHVKE